MRLLTNDERKCFALSLVQDEWSFIELPKSKYDNYTTCVYVSQDNRVVKVILLSEKQYLERDYDEQLSSDRIWILPKTAKGKPVKFTSANITKKTPIGMALSYYEDYISLYSNTNDCDFYLSSYAGINIKDMSDFYKWVDNWCTETTDKEIADIEEFANTPKRHVKFKEGDFFRFRLDRHNWGYGRIIINYDDFRKKNIPFWDVFMCKPILAGIYHIVTENKNIAISELDELQMLPPEIIMDNIFYYGECEIIGNLPVDESKIDFPVHYGQSIDARDINFVAYQCGRKFLTLYNTPLLYKGFINNGICPHFDIDIELLQRCINNNSNEPYWEKINSYSVNEDLRNPKNKKQLADIRKQFGLD